MGESKPSAQGNDDVVDEGFRDASDEFPFYDCGESFSEKFEPDDDLEVSSIITRSSQDPKPSLEKLATANLRRRRYASRNDSQSSSSSVSLGRNYDNHREDVVGHSDEFNGVESESASSTLSSGKLDESKLDLSLGKDQNSERKVFDEEMRRSSRILDKLDGAKLDTSSEIVEKDAVDADNKEFSAVPCLDNENRNEFSEGNQNFRETRDTDSSVLFVLAGLVIKAIGFQFNLFINFVSFPIWVIYSSYMFLVDPFRVTKRVREYLFGKVLGMSGNLSAVVYEWFKEHQSWLKLGLKFGWGFLWSLYVCVILVGLLVSAFIVGGVLINIVMEKPIKIRENLNFDYTEKSPTALVPIIRCRNQEFGADCNANVDVMESDAMRVIPLNHKLQVTVALKLPESDYNRNLGIFQVRVDFLAPDGKTLASSRRPCMLQFRSEPIRLLLTFLKVAPLITGYTSESQDLNIKFRGFVEGVKPTACLRVVLEQRAEFAPGAGIPEIYAASLTLETEQPLVKRILWYWRRTLYIWVSMTVLVVELLFTLLCCKPIIIPRVSLGARSANGNTR
ncbi:OLC1v1022034C1 [Oldenlandia corymbosa var. corymbosa]|uniref:OLC1v1022034C1 n=1 Tax=Oldenlandia corymbosa var. corymbosa TaxID=529605 RepID=A0AAV1BWZ3_OLDCO|nr:OLC1v1022034C1 [Oldenlandia corymbosa var. corymbosa]